MRNGIRVALAFIAMLSALFAPQAKAGPGGCTLAPSLVPFAYEEISVSSTAIGFTTATAFPEGNTKAVLAVVQIEDDAIRYRDDGLAPTATVGIKIAADDFFTVCGESAIRKLRMIRVTTDADANVAFYSERE